METAFRSTRLTTPTISALSPTPTVVGPTATSAPGPTSTPGPAATVTPTPIEVPLRFEEIAIREVTDKKVVIYFRTSRETTFTFYYGLSPKKLTEKIKGLDLDREHILEISDLTPNTRYYFTIEATDAKRITIKSDIFGFDGSIVNLPSFPSISAKAKSIGCPVFVLMILKFTGFAGKCKKGFLGIFGNKCK